MGKFAGHRRAAVWDGDHRLFSVVLIVLNQYALMCRKSHEKCLPWSYLVNQARQAGGPGPKKLVIGGPGLTQAARTDPQPETPRRDKTGQKTCAVLKIKFIISLQPIPVHPGPTKLQRHPGGSSNGRTAAFGVADLGSNPSPPATKQLPVFTLVRPAAAKSRQCHSRVIVPPD